jgi:hypothetical protein
VTPAQDLANAEETAGIGVRGHFILKAPLQSEMPPVAGVVRFHGKTREFAGSTFASLLIEKRL